MYIVYIIINVLKFVIIMVNFWYFVYKLKCFFKILWVVLGVNVVFYIYVLNKNVCV